MTKKDLKMNLVDLGIHKEKYLDEDIVEQFDADEIYQKDGHSYLIYDSDLSSDEINTALLARQTKDLKSIKKMITIFVGVSFLAFILSVISILCAAL